MFHQYNQSAFEITDLTDTDKFTFPDVCLNTQETCTVSPTQLCGANGREICRLGEMIKTAAVGTVHVLKFHNMLCHERDRTIND